MEWVKLGDVATYINGFAFKPADWLDEGKPIIRIQNLTNSNSKYNYTNLEIDPKYNVKKGDVLISWSATLDVFEWEKEEAYLNQHIFKVVFDKRDIDKDYFKYIVKNAIYSSVKLAHGSTMKHLTKTNFENIKIPIYDTETEKKISKKLRLAENIISTRKAQIAALDELVQSVFYEMFGDVNNLNANNYTHLEDLAEITMGQSPKGDTHNEEGNGMPLLNGPAEFGLKYPEAKKWTTDSKKESKVGDILFCVRASVGLMNISDKEYSIGRGLAAISVEDPFQRSFIFKSLYISNDYLKKVSTGSTYPSINKEALGKIPIINADEKNIIKFNDLSEAIEAQKAKLQTSLEEMETLVDALMQEAFSGNLG